MTLPRPSTLTTTPASAHSPAPAENTANAQYRILRIYLKGASPEVPDMANVPRQAISPDVGVDMQTLANPAGAGALECVLRIALHARLEGKTIFLVEVSVAGVFELDISNMEDAQRFVRKIAPSVLFPFARRDLASLTVAAGFQPVLLDHIDFDAMLAQVITAQRLTRKPTPMPMRLDVIAAKPAEAPISAGPTPIKAAPAPLVAPMVTPVKAMPEQPETKWSDTQPSLLPELTEPLFPASLATGKTPLPAGGPALQIRPKRRARKVALAVLGLATLGATVAWLTQREPVAVVSVRTSPAPNPVATKGAGTVTLVVPTATQPAKLPPDAEQAIAASRARLADQPAVWFTLDMGSAPLATPLATLFPALAPLPDRPLFVLAGKDDSLRLLYGVFPSQAAAELVRSQLQQSEQMKGRQAGSVVPIGGFL